ncbi:MAG TPA: hypothetical protein VNO33_24020 [Kofleriaceae bacterium]|nr:hypothetical protein [Kofleriaceae bacterium]
MSRAEPSNRTLVRYLLGEMTRSEIEETERLIADSRRTGQRVAELREMMDDLRQPPEWADSVDLVGEIGARLARKPGRAAREIGARRRRWAIGGGATALAAAAAVLLVMRPGEPDPLPGEVRPKAAAPPGDPDRWVGIQLARPRDGAPEVVEAGDRLAAGELQVSYTNLGTQPYSHLMVFAVDRAGQVRWLYPAYEVEGTDPHAIPIASGAGVLLPDLVEHEFARGRLAICGLFLRRPLGVGQVETVLGGAQPAAGARLPFPGSGQHCFDVEVE